jgi:hypothetical protein
MQVCKFKEEIYSCPSTPLLANARQGHTRLCGGLISQWVSDNQETHYCCGMRSVDVHETPTTFTLKSNTVARTVTFMSIGLFYGIFLSVLYVSVHMDIWWIGIVTGLAWIIVAPFAQAERTCIIDKASGQVTLNISS